MLRLKEIRLIPHWIAESVQRKGLPLETVFDAEKLLQFVNLNDLIGYCALSSSRFQKILFGEPPVVKESQQTVQHVVSTYDMFFTLAQSLERMNDAGAAAKQFQATVGNHMEEEYYQEEVFARLFTEDSKQTKYEKAFHVYDASPDYIGIVIYPGFFVGRKLDVLQAELIEATLKQLYVYAEHHTVAKTPLFRRYLERLASHETIVSE